MELLTIQNLITEFLVPGGRIRAVDDVSLNIYAGRTLCVVGESGSGKTMTALSILRLIPAPEGRITSGKIFFDGRDLLTLSQKRMRKIRGKRIAMIFQEPMTALNPVFTIGSQMEEMFTLHQLGLSKAQAKTRTKELLDLVGIPDPEKCLKEYPHQLSGGMRQRVMIAIALSCHPDLLIADEPTSALDVTIQAQILDLIRRLQRKLKMAVMLITHDFGIVADTADDVVVMYAGKVVEESTCQEIFRQPQHPYTYGLMKSIPDMDQQQKRLYSVPGVVPNLGRLPQGCRFSNRCEFKIDACTSKVPDLKDQGAGHQVRCVRPMVWKNL